MAEKRVFRQAALDRLASPDQLDRLLPVADRHGWAVLAMLGALAAALAGWGFAGSIPVTQQAQGMLAATGGPVLLFTPAERGRLAAPGMPVLLVPAGGQGAPLHGTVDTVSPTPISREAQAALLGNAALAGAVGPGPGYAVRVRLAPGATSPPAGVLVTGQVTLRRQRPVELLLPGR